MCATADSKYKCPTCSAPYCSVVCCRGHKDSGCAPATISSAEATSPVLETAVVEEALDVSLAALAKTPENALRFADSIQVDFTGCLACNDICVSFSTEQRRFPRSPVTLG